MPQQHNKKMKIEIEKILSDMLLIKFEFFVETENSNQKMVLL